jgi:hypothetical protein
VQSASGQRPAPPPGLFIPDIKRGPDAWRTAVKQWEEPISARIPALKDWPDEWYRGEFKDKFAMKRMERGTIADAYNAYVSAFFRFHSLLIATDS